MSNQSRECFSAVMTDVPDNDWPEYVRKIGLPENDFQRMYKNHTAMSKHDMLVLWNQRAGLFNATLENILRGVADEVVVARDREVDGYFRQLGIPNLISARDKAWFIYSFIQQYTDLDQWNSEVVRKKLQIKEHKLSHLRQNFSNNVQEQMYRTVWLFAQTNKLTTVDQLKNALKNKNLQIPPDYHTDEMGVPEGDRD